MANFAIYDAQASLSHWRVLLGDKIRADVGDLSARPVGIGKVESEIADGSTWSRACYAYGVAVCLLDDGLYNSNEQAQNAVKGLMERIPQLVHRIAGKSIPMEVKNHPSKLLEYLYTTDKSILCRNSSPAKRANSFLIPGLRSLRLSSHTHFSVFLTLQDVLSRKGCCRRLRQNSWRSRGKEGKVGKRRKKQMDNTGTICV
jgi:hypothetical protein